MVQENVAPDEALVIFHEELQAVAVPLLAKSSKASGAFDEHMQYRQYVCLFWLNLRRE